jgi:hypothetical protein
LRAAAFNMDRATDYLVSGVIPEPFGIWNLWYLWYLWLKWTFKSSQIWWLFGRIKLELNLLQFFCLLYILPDNWGNANLFEGRIWSQLQGMELWFRWTIRLISDPEVKSRSVNYS